MTEQLKPCPFCGTAACEPENITPTKRPSWKIRCTWYCVSMVRSTKKEVIKDWNTRANSEVAEALKERIKKWANRAHEIGECLSLDYTDTAHADAILLECEMEDLINTLQGGQIKMSKRTQKLAREEELLRHPWYRKQQAEEALRELVAFRRSGKSVLFPQAKQEDR